MNNLPGHRSDRSVVTGLMRLMIFGLVATSLWQWSGTTMGEPRSSDLVSTSTDFADQQLARGLAAYRNGKMEQAVTILHEANQMYGVSNRVDGQMDSLAHMATIYRDLGMPRLCIEYVQEAIQIAQSNAQQDRLARLYGMLGATLIIVEDFPSARTYLQQGLAMAQELNDSHAQAAIFNDMGSLASAEGNLAAALEHYLQSAELARIHSHDAQMAQATVNAATAATRARQPQALDLNVSASNAITAVPDTHQSLYMRISVGQNLTRLAQRATGAQQTTLLRQAHDILQHAATTARQRGDQRALSYALGTLAPVYELEERIDDALALSRQATFIAQQDRNRDALYRWQWQSGRLLNKKRQLDQAIASYRHAVDTVESIRQDVAIGYGNQGPGLMPDQGIGPLYSELADLLLQKAAVAGSRGQDQHYLHQARETLEQFKTVEMIDYFQDECVDLLQAKSADVEAVAAHTAVIYVVPLPDRTELLLSVGDGLKRYRVPATRDELIEQVMAFRSQLENLANRRELNHAQTLYSWLIAPIESELRSRAVHTLVFVPDGALRLVPMAALHDGNQYLIQRYAIAMTPGLTLMDPQQLSRSGVRVLAGGLSVASHEGFTPLQHVPEELTNVSQLFEGTKLLDQQFLKDRLETEIRLNQYSIVHIASHGQFGRTADETFVLTYDQKLTLPQLEQLIRPSRFRDAPVELLTLSACQTAMGDDRTALGLAGVALKAGARSAVATLWPIEDRAALMLISDFYRRLREDPTITKAKAMQQAQIQMIADWQYDAPYFWSPFLLIGNWL